MQIPNMKYVHLVQKIDLHTIYSICVVFLQQLKMHKICKNVATYRIQRLSKLKGFS